jgi:hypothetical protein
MIRANAFDVVVVVEKRRRLSVRKKRSALKNAMILNKSLTRKPEREYRQTTAKGDP